MDNIIEEKYQELNKYLTRLARNKHRVQSSHAIEDVVQRTLLRLLEENNTSAFESARRLWGRATNILAEEAAQMFADSMTHSGVKHQAHHAARRALEFSDGDPKRAYETQKLYSSARVGKPLMYLVANQSNTVRDPQQISNLALAINDHVSHLSETDEDNIRVAISGLSEIEQSVVRMKIWGLMQNVDIARELQIERQKVARIYDGALRKLKVLLSKAL